MPLADNLPVIDDRRYSDILEELRTRIPRYTPEWKGWTDLNDSDPGITLSQLMAWLSEMMIYRMNKVPDLNYIKFLELLGIELQSPQPAMVDITFPVQEDWSTPFVIVQRRTQVSAEDENGGSSIVFETNASLYALAAKLTSVQASDGFTYRNVTEENNSLQTYLPFDNAAKAGAALYLGFEYPAKYTGVQEFPKVDLDLAVIVSDESSQGQPKVTCTSGSAGDYSPARLVWESWNGSTWRALTIIKDDSLALTRSGHVILQTPPAGELKRTKIGETGSEQGGWFIRARVDRSEYVKPPRILTIQPNTIQATQAETVQREVLGGSNGTRNQTFTLESKPVLPESLQLAIDEGDGLSTWTRVDDFFDSQADDTHYVLDANSGVVRLGGERINGSLRGHVPVANVNSPGSNVVALEYRFGGGARGNVGKNKLTTLVTPVEGIDAAKVTNIFDAHSGRNEETIAEAKERASRSVRSRSRAVTREDFEQIAQEAANVKRAKALPLFHPDFPGTEIPGVISVIIVPDSDAVQPMPSEGMMRQVCAYLNARRLLTAEVYVLAPTYQKVEIRGDVIVANDADLREVKEKIDEVLGSYFHPLKGGDNDKGWPFGGTIFYSRVMNRVFEVPGVARIEQLDIYLDGLKKNRCDDVDIKPNALIYSTEHHVDVHYAPAEETA